MGGVDWEDDSIGEAESLKAQVLGDRRMAQEARVAIHVLPSVSVEDRVIVIHRVLKCGRKSAIGGSDLCRVG